VHRTVSISSTSIYNQGALANHSGSANESSINENLFALGALPVKKRYESSWSLRSEVDCSIEELGIVAEYKNQNSAGTVDQKGGTELFNAGQKIFCDHYVLVFSGTHWNTTRGKKLFKMYQDMAEKFNRYPEDFCVAAKQLHVMKEADFMNFVKNMKEDIHG
jgi:hypothetical protein